MALSVTKDATIGQKIVGVSAKQHNSVQTAIAMAPPSWHDGLVRYVANQLGASPTDAAVSAAIIVAMNDHGIPILFAT